MIYYPNGTTALFRLIPTLIDEPMLSRLLFYRPRERRNCLPVLFLSQVLATLLAQLLVGRVGEAGEQEEQ